jgi:predicted transcriptional regulator of viral defense system
VTTHARTQPQAAIDALIAAVAATQHGLITSRQLTQLGLDHNAIEYRLRIGRLHRVYRGVYAVGHLPTSPLARAAAAVYACGPGAALSHGAAGVLWGMATEWVSPIEVTTPGRHRIPNIGAHRSRLDPRDVTLHHGILVTTPARTLLDIACKPPHDTTLTRAYSQATIHGYLHHAEVDDVLARHAGSRGAGRLRAVHAPDEAPSRSEFEDRFTWFAKRYGLPTPQTNRRVRGHEVDAFFPQHGVVVELDGYRYHKDREAFEDDRDKDADLTEAGLVVVRITWPRLTKTPEREAARLLRILERTRRARLNPDIDW